MILWGPPGSGKTTLARLFARHTDALFHELSAVHSGALDVRWVGEVCPRACTASDASRWPGCSKAIEELRGQARLSHRHVVLFLDEM